MRKIILSSLNIFMALIVLTLGFAPVKAAELKPVKDLHVIIDGRMDSTNTLTAYLDWSNPNPNSHIQGFNIYEAEGKTDNKDNFKLIAAVVLSNQEDWWANKGPMFYVYTTAGYKNATYYVAPFDSNGEGKNSNFAYCEAPKPHVSLSLYQDPVVNSGFAGKELTINILSKSNIDGITVNYELGKDAPAGMTIDPTSGVITWTPAKGGFYNYTVFGSFVYEGDKYKLGQGFTIRITVCENPGSITGTVKDNSGNAIDKGWVIVYQQVDSLNGKNGNGVLMIQDGTVESGAYTISNLDKGTYYVIAGANDQRPGVNMPTWFKNTTVFEEATPIEVACGDVFTADIQLMKDPGAVVFTTKPQNLTLKLGDKFSYDAGAEGGDAAHPLVYKFINAPDGATIDSQTGLVEFTPSKNGVYHFAIAVYVQGYNGKNGMDQQNFDLRVTQCDQLSTITINVNDEDGTPVKYGYAALFIADSNSLVSKNINIPTVEFKNGVAEFTDVDAGSYFVEVWGNSDKDSLNDQAFIQYYPTFYKNAYNPADATPIVIDCGSAFTGDIVLKKMVKPNLFTISGKVTDESDGSAIKYAYIGFIGTDKITGQVVNEGIMTDKNGSYEAQLPDSYTWIVRADAGGLLTGRMKNSNLNNGKLYYPEYYDNVTDQLEAKVFDLTANVDGVDFALSVIPDFDNSISGNVVNADGASVGGASVIAYLVQAADGSVDHLYFGRTAESDSNGVFRILNLIPGKYVIFAWDNSHAYAPGFYLENNFVTQSWQTASQVEVAGQGNSGDYSLKLDAWKNVNGICKIFGKVGKHKNTTKISDNVLSSDALQGAVVYAADMNGKNIASVFTAEDGSFSLDGIAPGTYRLIADKVGYQTYIGDVTVDDNSNKSSNQELLLNAGTTGVEDNVTAVAGLYPNPASGSVTLTFETTGGTAEIKVLDMAGNVVITQNISTVQGLNHVQIPVSSVSQGAYFVTILSGGNYSMIPFAVVK